VGGATYLLLESIAVGGLLQSAPSLSPIVLFSDIRCLGSDLDSQVCFFGGTDRGVVAEWSRLFVLLDFSL
jgi:hypothetical protein